MKVAIIHEMLIKLWWAEKVLKSLIKKYKNADLYTLIYDEKKVWTIFKKEQIHNSVFKLKSQKIYNLTKNQRLSLLFMRKSIESLDFSKYNIVICSSSSFAHWILTKHNTKHIVYYHSPSRYLWDWTNEYKKDIWWNNKIKWFILNYLFKHLREWDYKASKRHDICIANSINTQKRIKKYYKKKSILLYPPVEIDRFKKKINKNVFSTYKKNYKLKWNDYFIIISALTEFKKIEIAIDAFNKIKNEKLFIIWEWNYKNFLLKKVKNKNIVFLWAKYNNDLVSIVQNSKWLIFPGEEDFWIVPIEVLSAWKPVFAFKWWGLKETITEWKTWSFFLNANWDDFINKFKTFNINIKFWKYKENNCIKSTLKYSEKEFIEKFNSIIKNSKTVWL